MKPIPIPIATIRHVIKVIDLTGRHGSKILRLAVPIISVIATVVREIKKKP